MNAASIQSVVGTKQRVEAIQILAGNASTLVYLLSEFWGAGERSGIRRVGTGWAVRRWGQTGMTTPRLVVRLLRFGGTLARMKAISTTVACEGIVSFFLELTMNNEQ